MKYSTDVPLIIFNVITDLSNGDGLSHLTITTGYRDELLVIPGGPLKGNRFRITIEALDVTEKLEKE